MGDAQRRHAGRSRLWRKARPEVDPCRSRAAGEAYYERKPDIGRPEPSSSPSERAGTAARRSRGSFTGGAHRRDHTGDLRLPARAGHRRPALHGQGHARAVDARRSAPRSRCWRRTASRPSSSATTASTPTPVISRAILAYNRGRTDHLADGIVITPSHNPPEDGGFKYNPPNGGPADTDVDARGFEDRANALLASEQRAA